MNQTIYFRKEVWDKLKEEEFKSNLINQLLHSHYGLGPHEATIQAKVTKVFKERAMQGLCKAHGIALDDRGKCLQKGCIYA